MKKASGILTFIGCLVAVIISIAGIIINYSKYHETDNYNKEQSLIYAMLFIVPLTIYGFGIYFTVKTKFGTTNPSVLDNLERENEIIKKQIEKKELLLKLESLEKNEKVS